MENWSIDDLGRKLNLAPIWDELGYVLELYTLRPFPNHIFP